LQIFGELWSIISTIMQDNIWKNLNIIIINKRLRRKINKILRNYQIIINLITINYSKIIENKQ